MKAFEIAEILEEKFPLCLAEEWDNVGFMIGRKDKEVKKVLVALDVTNFVVHEAVSNKADMIISHHPAIFSGMKSVTDDSHLGNRIIDLIRNDITVYSAHTNLDSANEGINSKLAKMFSLSDTKPVFLNEYGCGLGRIGKLKQSMKASEFAELAKNILKTPVRLSGDKNKMVNCVAVGSGACDDIIPEALKMGADLILTGDCKYHRNIDFVEIGAVVCDAGHYPTEIISMDIFCDALKHTDIEIIRSEMEDIFTFI